MPVAITMALMTAMTTHTMKNVLVPASLSTHAILTQMIDLLQGDEKWL